MIRLIIIAVLALSSCAPVYVPNVRNSPMFTKGGEFQASVQIGNGIEGQSAFAVTDHFGIMVNYSYIDATDPENEDDYLRHKLFEGGLGYFLNREDSFFEVFAGYGKGTGTTYESYNFFGSPEAAAATGRYNRYFIQPAFGVNKNDFQFSFAPRITMVDFYEFSTEQFRTPIEGNEKFFFEPAVIGRINFNNHIFVTFQAGAALRMSEDIFFDRRKLQMAAGLGFRLGAAKALVSRL